MSRLRFVAAVGLTLVVLGCSPTPPARVLTDPREILVTAIRTTAALSYVRVHADVKVSSIGAAAVAAGDFNLVMDVDLDIRHGQRVGRIATKGPAGLAENGPPGQAADVKEFITTVAATYMRSAGAARWTKTGGPDDGTGPTNAGFASIEALLANPGVKLELGEPAACSLGTCYHVVATAPGDIALKAVGAALGSGGGSSDIVMPPLTFDVLVDQATGLMSEVRFAATLQGSTSQLALVFSNPDLIVQIVAPPPGLTDDGGDNTGGFGAGAAPAVPAPTPMAESPGP